MSGREGSPSRSGYDVVIVGGAMFGASVAWFLSDDPDFDGSVLVVERDPSYERSSTAATGSCMRQQFSSEINVRVSQFAADFVRNFRERMGGDERVPEVEFQSFGYMYLAGSEGFAETLRESHAVQVAAGAGTRLMTPEEILHDYPFYNVEDIVLGSHNPVDEGYWDSGTVFAWWRRSARERGVDFVANEVVGLRRDRSGTAIDGVSLASGETIGCGAVVNCAGPRAARVAAMAGIALPVEPRKRHTWVFRAERPLERALPLTIDPSGVHVRQDGADTYQAGAHADHDPAVDPDDFAFDPDLWQGKVWPALAHRIPRFEAIRVVNEWVGHYAYNVFDHNVVVGPHPEIANFHFANGDSGHGLQQSPAIGRGLAELIVHGGYRTLDLSPFGYARIARAEPFVEKAVI